MFIIDNVREVDGKLMIGCPSHEYGKEFEASPELAKIKRLLNSSWVRFDDRLMSFHLDISAYCDECSQNIKEEGYYEQWPKLRIEVDVVEEGKKRESDKPE